jgi:hypothetical protein
LRLGLEASRDKAGMAELFPDAFALQMRIGLSLEQEHLGIEQARLQAHRDEKPSADHAGTLNLISGSIWMIAARNAMPPIWGP